MDTREIIRLAGGAQALAARLNINHQAVYGWQQVPAERVIELCRLTGLRPFDIRADLYPDPRWSL